MTVFALQTSLQRELERKERMLQELMNSHDTEEVLHCTAVWPDPEFSIQPLDTPL